MCYIAWQDGHTKTSIARSIGKNHATVINSCRMMENAFFAKDREIIETFDKLMAKLIEYVGTVPANLEEKDDTQPMSDPIWDQAKEFHLPKIKAQDKEDLIKIGMLEKLDGLYKMTPEAKAFCARLDNYFVKAKKKTDIQLMGKNFNDKIHTYREIFPAKKLPSW